MLGMSRPAFVAGSLVDRYGARANASAGVMLLALSALPAFGGLSHLHFLASSFLLSAGWNSMLVAGTTQLSADTHRTSMRMPRADGAPNGGVAAVMSFTSGALIAQASWAAVNMLALPALLIVLAVQARRTCQYGPKV
jgi:MFS family permease